MEISTLLPFLCVTAFATYIQTVTGFALGMILMGGVTVFDLMPISFTSVVISLVSFMNGAMALKGNMKALDKKRVMLTAATLFPAVYLGLVILDYLSDEFRHILQILLGLTIIVAGLMLMLKPEPLKAPSSNASFLAAGGAAGLLAGMFSMAGPPLVHLYYRQPFELLTIRLCLICIFLLSATVRTTIITIQGQLTLEMVTFALTCLPVVALFTWIGRRYPPPLDNTNMRRFAFFLLIGIGSSLFIKNLF